MILAITYADGAVFGHFGHTKQFKLYTIQDGRIVETRIVDTAGSGHGALAGFLQSLGVDTLVCGGIGAGAKEALKTAGITVYGGVTGPADEAATALLTGTLIYDPAVRCAHHDQHGSGHTCGDHGCGHH